ncbi:MAG: Tim44 domain-containing protein [Alphaproteobacteria bacterium]|jgi:predicted lipid-binding transport protein (Tim44 family)|nr:Tim44 domain-containing protein [Alphaproteobacteria bacterium]
MGSDSALIEVIILAVVAGFLILRLRSVLGKRHGEERPRYKDADRYVGTRPKPDDAASTNDSAADNVTPFPGVQRPSMDAAPPFGPAAKLHALDPEFNADEFLGGAREAFAIILSAYASGDRDTLRSLAHDDVYEPMEAAITDRESRGETLDATVIAIQTAGIDDVEVEGSIARVTVRLKSEQTNVLRNADGQPIDGAPNQVETIVDLWTYERDMHSDDPNWLLIETQPGE